MFEPSLNGIDTENVLLVTDAWIPLTVTLALWLTFPVTVSGEELTVAPSCGDVMVRFRDGIGINWISRVWVCPIVDMPLALCWMYPDNMKVTVKSPDAKPETLYVPSEPVLVTKEASRKSIIVTETSGNGIPVE